MRGLLLGAAAGPALHRKQPWGGDCPPGGAQDRGLRGQAPSEVRGRSPEGPVRTPRWPPPHYAGAWWSQPPAPGPYSPGHHCRLSGGPSWCPGSHSTASNLMAGAHIRGFLSRETWPWEALPMEPGWGRNGRRLPPRSGWGRGVGWAGGSAESPQAPAGHQDKEAHSRPQAPPCCLLSALSSREKQQEGAAAPVPALRVPPGGQGEEAGPSASQQPARPPTRHSCQESFFSPRPQPRHP